MHSGMNSKKCFHIGYVMLMLYLYFGLSHAVFQEREWDTMVNKCQLGFVLRMGMR